jgi:ABC-2 type transport system permease protein
MWKFIKYEWKLWLKSPMLWILLGVNTLLIYGASASDSITIGGDVGSVHKNAPYVIQNLYAMMSLINLLMVTAFMSATALRDYQYNMHQLVFSCPINKRDYFFGKFIGGFTIAFIPMLGVSLGNLLALVKHWAIDEKYGPTMLSGHLSGILTMGLPNVFFFACILFSLAIIFKNQMVPFVGAIVLLVLYIISQIFASDIDKEMLAMLSDPLGGQAQYLLSKYYTVAEKNAHAVPLTGGFLYNRILWVLIGLGILLFSYFKFSFNTKNQKVKAEKKNKQQELPIALSNIIFTPNHKSGFSASSLFGLVKFELFSMIKNPTFIIIMLLGLLNLVGSLTGFEGMYGSKQYPVTYQVVDSITGAFGIFMIAIIIFYSGHIVWRDRDSKMAEIKDATSVATSTLFLSKLFAMIAMIVIVLSSTILLGMLMQAIQGFTAFNIKQYAISVLGIEGLRFTFLSVLALLFHYLINNRYIAYFAYLVFILLSNFLWRALDVDTLMVRFGALPRVTYSDMNGYAPYVKNVSAYAVYWILFNAVLAFVAYAFFARGKEDAWKYRLQKAKINFSKNKFIILALLCLFTTCASFVYYNTSILNKRVSEDESDLSIVAYEKKYKKYENIPQPKFVKMQYNIDVKPESAEAFIKITGIVINDGKEPIKQIHITLPPFSDSFVVHIPNSKLNLRDDDCSYRIYDLNTPMQVGDSSTFTFTHFLLRKGFEDQASKKQIANNGSFFSTEQLLPNLGYLEAGELSDKDTRIKYKLPKKVLCPALDTNNVAVRASAQFGANADYVTVNTIISTSPYQTAIAPGDLIRTWDSAGRKYFNYALNTPSLNFYSFLSADVKKATKKFKGIDLEVYYDSKHAYNVPSMLNSLEKSLDYYTTNFGPYYHKQARIIEYPRYTSFAQSFPGTMPYGEGIGFIADMRKQDEELIDGAFYIVAHEMGHQYWAHQFVGCNMEGSVIMSETFSQYSALMVMEKEFGKDKMKKFLEYEMNDYLRARGKESRGEKPLYRTDQQNHVYYQKGSVVMYYLKEMIGEAKVNEALRSLLTKFGGKKAPYATSMDAVIAFRNVTPDSLQYLITDLFQDIILFDNHVVSSSVKKIGLQYEVKIKTSSEKFRSDSLGAEKPIAINDYIDIGIFAKNEKSKSLGKSLLMKRIKIAKKENEFTFILAEEPAKVGIDPYNYLVDRMPDDNVKKVE